MVKGGTIGGRIEIAESLAEVSAEHYIPEFKSRLGIYPVIKGLVFIHRISNQQIITSFCILLGSIAGFDQALVVLGCLENEPEIGACSEKKMAFMSGGEGYFVCQIKWDFHVAQIQGGFGIYGIGGSGSCRIVGFGVLSSLGSIVQAGLQKKTVTQGNLHYNSGMDA